MGDLIRSKDIERLIFEFRGIQVMIDSDLATLYGTETKRLKQQVKRNTARFPEDFMFEKPIMNAKRWRAGSDGGDVRLTAQSSSSKMKISLTVVLKT